MAVSTDTEILQTAHQFQISGDIESIVPFGNGHINDSFQVINKDPLADDYLLQRVNHLILNDVDGLMSNILNVTRHLKNKSTGDQDTLELILSREGGSYVSSNDGFWRMYKFMKNLRSHELAEGLLACSLPI